MTRVPDPRGTDPERTAMKDNQPPGSTAVSSQRPFETQGNQALRGQAIREAPRTRVDAGPSTRQVTRVEVARHGSDVPKVGPKGSDRQGRTPRCPGPPTVGFAIHALTRGGDVRPVRWPHDMS